MNKFILGVIAFAISPTAQSAIPEFKINSPGASFDTTYVVLPSKAGKVDLIVDSGKAEENFVPAITSAANRSPEVRHTDMMEPVPVPQTGAMIICGLALVAFSARRQSAGAFN